MLGQEDTFSYMLMALAFDSRTNRSTKNPSSLSVTVSRQSISCFARPCLLHVMFRSWDLKHVSCKAVKVNGFEVSCEEI